MPPDKIRPITMKPVDTIQQVITTRQSSYATLKDPENGQVVYKGIFSYHDMEQEPTFHWVIQGMDDYKPDAAATEYLQKTSSYYKLLVFMGTWCEDSQNLIPKLYKILQTINVNWEDIMIVGMDRAKTTNTAEGQQLVNEYKVTLVPTIVVLDRDGAETGRITETVKKSVEWDLVGIVGSKK
jgi:thiol-disulfide isomerase/thioredoxin